MSGAGRSLIVDLFGGPPYGSFQRLTASRRSSETRRGSRIGTVLPRDERSGTVLRLGQGAVMTTRRRGRCRLCAFESFKGGNEAPGASRSKNEMTERE
jgi:hypothetical protein